MLALMDTLMSVSGFRPNCPSVRGVYRTCVPGQQSSRGHKPIASACSGISDVSRGGANG